MAAFRPLGQFVQYLLDSGEVNAGGSITTYETDLTTNKLTYSNPALSVPNPFIIPLDAFGRPEVDVWGDGAYGMVMKDADGTTITTLNNIRSDSPVVDQIPALVAGQFLTNNGSILQWADVLQVPDPTGLASYVLTSDGENAVWQQPETPDTITAEIVTTDTSIRLGNSDEPTKQQFQYGTDSAPASGTKTTTKAVTFPIPYATTPVVLVTPTGGPFAPGNGITGYWADVSVTAQSLTGFTVTFNTNHGESNSDGDINTPVTFGWLSIGTREVVSG